MPPDAASLDRLRDAVVGCRLCPRLVRFREGIPARAAFRGQEYWRRPVPGFGDPRAWMMVLGLAPAAHGGNRTGRVFTGDESARFLMGALHRAGLASQPTSESRWDGLSLNGCYIAAAARCTPPDNRPSAEELENCSPYLDAEMELLENLSAVVALGRVAFGAYLAHARRRGASVSRMAFGHGVSYAIDGLPRLYGAYHPSPRNTYTGKLTARMLLNVFEGAKRDRARGLTGSR